MVVAVEMFYKVENVNNTYALNRIKVEMNDIDDLSGFYGNLASIASVHNIPLANEKSFISLHLPKRPHY